MRSTGTTRTAKLARHNRTMVAGFNVYRVGGMVADAVAPPRIHTYVHGSMTDSVAEVVATGSYGVVFRANPRLLMALSHTGMAFVESPLHAMNFRAQVLDVRLEQCCVVLSNFEQVPDLLERRSLARVTPPRPIEVHMSLPDLDLRGRIADLSAVALAADFGIDSLSSLSEHSKAEVRVATTLTEGAALTLTGRIRRAHRLDDDDLTWWRVVVALSGGSEAEPILDEYVRRRTAEILAELQLAPDGAALPVPD